MRSLLVVEGDVTRTGNRVGLVLNQIALFRDLPAEIITDNGAEFTSEAMRLWAYEHKDNQDNLPDTLDYLLEALRSCGFNKLGAFTSTGSLRSIEGLNDR